jgi:NADH-quinone oxidoreductase subunit A
MAGPNIPAPFAEVYLPILLQVILAMAVAGGLIGASALLGKRVRSAIKEMPYECGLAPKGTTREPVSVKFYMVAMVFILFDIETVFLYPWAVVYRQLRLFAFLEMLLFVALILAGFFYIWKKGALDWSVEEGAERRR